MNSEPEIPESKTVKQRKKREMTPELLEKLRLARERASELRAMAKETKAKLPDNLPEKEKSKVAQYLATRKAIKEKIKQEIVEEIEKTPATKSAPVKEDTLQPEPVTEAIVQNEQTEHPVDEKGFKLPLKSTEPSPPLPKKSEPITVVKKTKKPVPEPESESESSDDEYTTIKVPKKKIIKWKKYAERPLEPEKPKKPLFNPYTTQHLINLKMGGYKF